MGSPLRTHSQMISRLVRQGDPCEAGNRRWRFIGFNCGVATPAPDHWPICLGFRKGNWLLPESPGFGPYSPDTITLGSAGGTVLEFVSAGIWRSSVVASSVRINSLVLVSLGPDAGPVIGTYLRYYEIVFTGDDTGDAVLTAHTIEHPDPRFPASVEWSNALPLADSSRLSLTTSTQFADAAEVQPWLSGGESTPSADGPHKPHGQPYFHPDGTYNSLTHHDLFYNPSVNGEIPCFQTLALMAGVSRLCGTIAITPWPIYCLQGGVLSSSTNSLSGEIDITATAHEGSGSPLLYLDSDTPLCNSEGYSAGAEWGDLELSWDAGCDGVTVTATARAKYVQGTSSELTVTWTWTDQPFDWWQTTLTGSATVTVTKPDATTSSNTYGITLALHECGYYSGGGGGEDLPCLEQPIYLTLQETTVEFDATDPDDRSAEITISGSGFEIVFYFTLTRISEPEPPMDTVLWRLTIHVYDVIAGTLACTDEADFPTDCLDGVLNGNAEISLCEIDLIIHTGD